MTRTVRVAQVDDATASELRGLWARAADADGLSAVSEAFRLAVGPARDGVVHLLRYDGDDTLVGYAQVAQVGTPDAVAELVVDPAHRRRGHGRALLDAVLAEGAGSVWAHGMLPAAGALAHGAGLVVTRELHHMTRPLTADDAVDPVLPQGFSVRSFQPGQDEKTWLAVNAAAFVAHPEQGSITLRDLRDRMGQEWFDPEGLLLVEDSTARGAAGEHPVAAFHWTKVEPGVSGPGRTGPGPARGGDEGAGTSGEVYVVGVHPAYQGRGLAGPVTRLGLAHLARRGLTTVELYVDGDNPRALTTYRRLGFTDATIHVVYGHRPQS